MRWDCPAMTRGGYAPAASAWFALGIGVSLSLPIPAIQALQVVTIAGVAPGVSGVIAKAEARLQGRRGPRIAQPYYDLAKLFRKESLAPEGASWVFLAAPVAAFACYLTVPLLIPVLTSYPLPLGYMGDILGGGFILSLASFVWPTAALETGSPYAQLGSQPGQDVRGDHRAGRAVRRLHRGAGDRDGPPVRTGRDGPFVGRRLSGPRTCSPRPRC